MSTVIKHRDGRIEKRPGTQYHKDGTGPRDEKGRLITDADTTTADKTAEAAPAAAEKPAAKKEGSK